MICAIAALGQNRVIGKDNELLWRIPDDFKRFKALTTGHPIVMGRKTFESLGKPLPNRTNIVITRDTSWSAEGIVVMHSIEEAVEKAKEIDKDKVFIIGGAQIYEQALPFVDRLYVTLIDEEKEGDAYFPAYESLFTKMIFHEHRDFEGLKYQWVDLEK
ncbi:MAG: dihydrofolate reductase [Patescibacteria group bacterium]|nr:dihydrofolate reductase [Patescibacteria group bacterium]